LHIEPVTQFENQRRGIGNGQRDKTHCPQGHAYSGDNLKIYRGERLCRVCETAKARKYESSGKRDIEKRRAQKRSRYHKKMEAKRAAQAVSI
jgi:hypothetical protein